MVPKVVKFIKKVEWWLPGPGWGEEMGSGGSPRQSLSFAR